MPAFVPRRDLTKKEETLGKREDELKHALRRGFEVGKVNRAAERVREAYLSLLKAKRHLLDTGRSDDRTPEIERHLRHLLEETQFWTSISVDEIVHRHEARHPNGEAAD